MMSKILSISLITAMSLLLVTSSMNNAYATVSITPTTNAATLTSTILGPGLTVVGGSEVFLGAMGQGGTFTSGLSSMLGIDSGIVLTSGNVNQIPGPNNFVVPQPVGETLSEDAGAFTDDDISMIMGTAGDAGLTALAGFQTFDAAVLSFDFTLPAGSHDLVVKYVFASEEYIDWINTNFNDVFSYELDGTNIALTPGTNNPVTINTINPTINSALYINNVVNSNGFPVAGADHSFDGYTVVLMAEAMGVAAGQHTMKFAVADTFDGILDAAVFIEAFGLMCPEGTTGVVPNCEAPVGGEFLPIDTTALLLAGAQTNAVWIMSALAVIGSIAFGALYITSKKN